MRKHKTAVEHRPVPSTGHSRRSSLRKGETAEGPLLAMCAPCSAAKARKPKAGEARVSIVPILAPAISVETLLLLQGGRCVRCGHVVDSALAVVTRVER